MVVLGWSCWWGSRAQSTYSTCIWQSMCRQVQLWVGLCSVFWQQWLIFNLYVCFKWNYFMSSLPPSYDLVFAVRSKQTFFCLFTLQRAYTHMLIMISIVLVVNILRMHPQVPEFRLCRLSAASQHQAVRGTLYRVPELGMPVTDQTLACCSHGFSLCRVHGTTC